MCPWEISIYCLQYAGKKKTIFKVIWEMILKLKQREQSLRLNNGALWTKEVWYTEYFV
jgi:hypothetical protein